MLGREPGGSKTVQLIFVIRPRVPVREEQGFDVPLSELGQRFEAGIGIERKFWHVCVSGNLRFLLYTCVANCATPFVCYGLVMYAGV